MIEPDLKKLLSRVRRHQWLRCIAIRLRTACLVTTAILIVLSLVHLLLTPVAMQLWIPAAVAPLLIALIVGVVADRPALDASARLADRWFNTDELLGAAWYLGNAPGNTVHTESAASRHLSAQAGRWLEQTIPVFPPLLSKAEWSSGLAALLLASTGAYLLLLTGNLHERSSQLGQLDQLESSNQGAVSTTEGTFANSASWTAMLNRDVGKDPVRQGAADPGTASISNPVTLPVNTPEAGPVTQSLPQDSIGSSVRTAGSGSRAGQESADDTMQVNPDARRFETETFDVARQQDAASRQLDNSRTVIPESYDGDFADNNITTEAAAAEVISFRSGGDLSLADRMLQIRYLKEKSNQH